MPERLIFLTLGFISTLSQTVLIRLLMNRLGGSELAVGLAISGWLVLSGIASLLSGKTIDRTARKREALAILLAGLPSALIIGLLLAAWLPQRMGLVGGQIPSPLEFTFFAWLATAPTALLLGIAFNLCVSISREDFGASLKAVYLYQAFGAAAGGFISAWLLLEILSSLEILWLIFALCIMAALLLPLPATAKQLWTTTGVFILAAFAALLVFASDGSWRLPSGVDGAQISQVKENRFGILSLLENAGEYVVFSGSNPVSDNRRPENDEELVLLAHCLNPKAHSIAWLGGALAGPFNLSQQYAFWNRYVYVNPDRDFVEFENSRLNKADPLRIEIQDMRTYVREGSERFDLLIANGGDPQNLAANRLFTAEFFRQAASRLTDSGVLVFFALEPGNYIPEDEARFLASLAKGLHGSFKYITILPFSRYTFAASNSPDIKQHAGVIDVELQMITPIPQHFTHEFVKDKLSTSRMEMLSRALQKAATANTYINSDSRPTALLQKSILDASRFGSGASLLSSWTGFGATWIYTLAFIIAVFSLLLSRVERMASAPALLAVALSGTAGIMLEITLMNSYQSLYGELYQMIGAMLAAYMSGLGVGAYLAHRINAAQATFSRRWLVAFMIFLCLLYLLSAAFLHYEFLQSDSGATGLLYIVLLFVAALLSGAVFMLASSMLKTENGKDYAFRAGLLAGADHLLPAFAAALLSIMVLPLIGAAYTLCLAAAFCLSAALSNLEK